MISGIDIETLEALYGEPSQASLVKVATKMTAEYRAWIKAARFCILSTVGASGNDASPRADNGPVVVELDDITLVMPDWRGNNRIESLRNIDEDGRVSLLFIVFGQENVIRVNGSAIVTTAAELLKRFEQKGQNLRSVVVITISEIYGQCARSILRSGLWDSSPRELPTMGDILRAQTSNKDQNV
jgi:PPOX class probable FMN-dependent enzyme